MSKETFARRASGLVRTASLKDVAMFNVYFTSFTLAVVFVYIVGLTVAPAGDLTLGLSLATVLLLFQVLNYAFMSATMPRSGGDYIFVSRTLHPLLGSLVGLTWVGWLGFWVGFGAFTMVTIGIGGLLTTLGYSTGNLSLVELASAISSSVNVFIIGMFVIIIFAALAIAGMRTYYRVQLVTFIIGVLSLIISYAILLSFNNNSFVNTFNALLKPLTNSSDTYHEILSIAQSNGWSFSSAFSLMQTLLWIPAAYIAIPWTMGTIFIGAEIKEVKRNQILGLVIAYLFVALVTLSTGILLVNVMGKDFLSAYSYLVMNPPQDYSLPIPPYYNYLIFLLIQNPILSIIANIGFILLGWMYMVQNLINTSRILMAMSFDKILPEWFSKVSDRFRTPVNATVFMFVISLIWLALITFTPYFLVASSMIAISFVVLLVAIGMLILPLKKKFFENSPVRWRIAGIPLVSLVAFITIIVNIFVFYNFITNPLFGANNTVSLSLIFGIWILGALVYLIAKFVQARKGIDVDLLYKELPEV